MPGTRPTVTRSICVMVGRPSTSRSVTAAFVWIESAGFPAWARRLARAIEKHAAWAAPISCSGFDPGPSSNRDLYVYPPLMVSPAVNVPVPVGMSPFHSALALAGMVHSSPVGDWSRTAATVEPTTEHYGADSDDRGWPVA